MADGVYPAVIDRASLEKTQPCRLKIKMLAIRIT
jgi:hypothetical protein